LTRDRLANCEETVDAAHDADLVFRHRIGLSPEQRIMHGRGTVGPHVVKAVEAVLERREQGLPLAYALRRADFAGLEFIVSEDVLIPRADTEWLVQRGQEWLEERNGRPSTLIDLGCGSGCIGITLARRFPSLRVILADVSQAALSVARDNAALHDVVDRCQFEYGDWFSWAKPRERVELILCNPPYVTRRDDPRLEESVRKHEPSLALYLDDEPEEFFFRLARKAVSHLSSGGLFAVEVGYDTAWPAKSAFNKIKAMDIGREIHDFAGIERVIWGIRK